MCRLLHHLGMASTTAHAVVMQCRDAWKNLAVKLANAKRMPVPVSVPDGASVGSQRQDQQGASGKAALSKTTSTAASFMMN